ncbi:MAG: ribosome-binding factor A [Gammaproteobacteria bacterium RIFCSPHIGHO2_02_FULL_39_13]|nr:MAG: ribosome-binding factor A [Gammaproteobacteria bacterium RIFCSPHIGHO2_02_FULL_39_13]OGT50065.1 MAG: ribosome-binding factor A [Gammaproteobacteria bacterium RIFCSPHIGHO2_12_FULL_39_24]
MSVTREATKSKRANRVAELIQTTIAHLLLKEVSDPRLRFVTITGVDLSPDGKNAVVFFSMLDPTSDHVKSAEKAFQKAQGFFRFQLSQSTEFRHTPQLIFRYDPSQMVGERISKLLKE